MTFIAVIDQCSNLHEELIQEKKKVHRIGFNKFKLVNNQFVCTRVADLAPLQANPDVQIMMMGLDPDQVIKIYQDNQ